MLWAKGQVGEHSGEAAKQAVSSHHTVYVKVKGSGEGEGTSASEEKLGRQKTQGARCVLHVVPYKHGCGYFFSSLNLPRNLTKRVLLFQDRPHHQPLLLQRGN